MPIENQIVQVTSYRLTDTAEAFTNTISALSNRTREDGPEGFYKTIRLAGLTFYGNLSQEIRQWLEERNVAYAGPLAAGFER